MRRTATITIIHISVVLLALAVVSRAQYEDGYCQIIDRLDDPIWEAYLGYAHEAGGDGLRKLGIIEFGITSGLLYFRTGVGEFDLVADLHSTSFTGRGDPDLPDLLLAAHLDIDYTVRSDDGYALRLGVAPGFYTESAYFGSDHLFYPFRIHGIRSFSPDTSALLGLNLYPGFHHLVKPRVGVRWAVSDYLLLDAFYPKTELVARPTYNWTVRAGVEIRDDLEYRLSGSDARKSLMLHDMRLYAGLDWLLTHNLQLQFQVARSTDRTLDFRRMEEKRDLDDTYYFRIGIGGLI